MLSLGRSSLLVKLESGRKNRSVIVRTKQGHDSISHNTSAGNGTAVDEREKKKKEPSTRRAMTTRRWKGWKGGGDESTGRRR